MCIYCAILGLYRVQRLYKVIHIKEPKDSDYSKHSKQARDMALAQVENILRNATNLMSDIRAGVDIEPWVAEKLTLANDYIL